MRTREILGGQWVEDLNAKTMGTLDFETLGTLYAFEWPDLKDSKRCVLGFISVPSGELFLSLSVITPLSDMVKKREGQDSSCTS